MITLNKIQTFLSKEKRDEYRNSEDRSQVSINPNYIVALESVKEWAIEAWPSCWDATRIVTVNGTWLVEGTVCSIELKIETSK